MKTTNSSFQLGLSRPFVRRCVGFVLGLATFSQVLPATTIDSVSVDRVYFASSASDVGRVLIILALDPTLPTAPSHVQLDASASFEYINVFGDLGTGEEWIVQNVPVLRAPGFTDDDDQVIQQSVFELPVGLGTFTNLTVYVTPQTADASPPLGDPAFGPIDGDIGFADQLLSGGGGKGGPFLDDAPVGFDSPLQTSHHNADPTRYRRL